MRFIGSVLFGSLFFAGVVALNPAGVHAAETTASSSASSGGFWNGVQKYGKASYLLEIIGPRTESLSGNEDGSGTELYFNHYGAIGATLGNGFAIKLTNLVTHKVDEEPESKTSKAFKIADPYLTFSKSKILHSEVRALNLDGYIRYYIPASRDTHDAVNKGAVSENGRGRMRILANPSIGFLDGALTLSGATFVNLYFNSLTPQERFDRATIELARTGKGNLGQTSVVSYRKDMYFVFNPILAYTVSPKVDVYLEWGCLWNHTTNGKWTSIEDDSDGQYLSVGTYWSPTKKISVNPYLVYQTSAPPSQRGLTKMSLSATAQYSFL